MSKDAEVRLHNRTAKLALIFGYEICILKIKEEYRPGTQQMGFLRPITGYKLKDHVRNETIAQQLYAASIENTDEYRRDWTATRKCLRITECLKHYTNRSKSNVSQLSI
jgi:hypothetical protein